MATVLSCTEATLLKGNVAQSRDGKWTAQRIFYVTFDVNPADHDEVCNATGIALGAAFKVGDTRTCSKRTPAALGSTTAYVVTLDYDVPDYTYDPNPLSRPDVISGKFSTEEKTYFLDCSSPPQQLTTPAGEPYPELQKRKTGVFRFTVKGNRASVPAATWAAYFKPACAINDSAITIGGIAFGAGILRIEDFSYEPKTENNYKFYECSWELVPDPDAWDLKLENRGFLAVDDDGITYQIVLDDGITAPTKPWPLDEDGSELDATDTPSTTTYKPYPKKDFSVFGFTAAAPF